jgi:site-specific DNA recombinase
MMDSVKAVKAAIYARVSTETQEKQQTIKSQLAELRRYADAQGLTIAQEFVDDGYSGTVLERPGLDALRDFVSAGGVETVLVLCPDRLSRKHLHLGILIEDFQKRGIKLDFVNQQVDDSPEGQLLLQIQGAVSEYERTKILDRTRRGKKHKAQQGHIVGGVAAYGYDYIRPDKATPGRWEINETEAEVVREIYRLFTEEQISLRAIVRELDQRGIPTRTGRPRWGKSAVYRVLSGEVYIGKAYFFKTYPDVPDHHREYKPYRQTLKTTKRLRDRSEWIPIEVPVIIDEATFAHAQKQLEDNKHFAARNVRRPYLLRGLLRCAKCGNSYVGSALAGKTYYTCTGNNPMGANRPERCGSRAVRLDRIEPLVWDKLTALLADPDLLIGHFERAQVTLAPSPGETAAFRKRLQKQIDQTDAEEMKVVRLYREEKIDEALLDAQLAEVRNKRDALRRQVEAQERDAQAAQAHSSTEDAIRAFCNKIGKGLRTADFEERQKLLRLAVDRIEIEPDADSGTLHGVIPLPDDNIGLRPRCRDWQSAVYTNGIVQGH